MIEVSDLAQSALTGPYRPVMAVDSFLGKKLLADDIPFASAVEDSDLTNAVPERVTFTIPRVVDNYAWSPVSPTHPLAANGQRLRVSLGINLGNDVIEWFQRGWFLIYETETSGDLVTVEAVGLLQWIQEAKFISPFQPIGTFESTLRSLIEPALTASVDGTLSTRNVPSNVVFETDRLAALNELLDAWPATARMSPEGYLDVLPVPNGYTAPVLELTNGVGGTIIRATGRSTRDDSYNIFVARGSDDDGTPFQGIAYDDTGGPKAYGGPFNPLPVPYMFESEVLNSVSQARAAAQTIRKRILKRTSVTYEIEMVPNPTIELDDVLRITTDTLTKQLVAVQGIRFSYVPDGGTMQLTVRTV